MNIRQWRFAAVLLAGAAAAWGQPHTDCPSADGTVEDVVGQLNCQNPAVALHVDNGRLAEAETLLKGLKDYEERLPCTLFLAAAYQAGGDSEKAAKLAKDIYDTRKNSHSASQQDHALFFAIVYGATDSVDDLNGLRGTDPKLGVIAACEVRARLEQKVEEYKKSPWGKACPAPGAIGKAVGVDASAQGVKEICELVAKVPNTPPTGLKEATDRLAVLTQLENKGVKIAFPHPRETAWRDYYHFLEGAKPGGTLAQRSAAVDQAVEALTKMGIEVPAESLERQRRLRAELTLVSALDGKEVPTDLAPLRESVAVIEDEQRQGYESALTLLALYPDCTDSAALSATDPCLEFLKSQAWQGKPYGALIGGLRTQVSQQVRRRVQEKYAELEQQLRDRQTDVAGLINDVETLRGYDVIAKDKLEQLKTRAQALQETLALRDRGDLAGAEARRRTLDRAIQDAWGLRIDIMCPAALQQMQALKSAPSAGGAAIDDYRKRYAVLSGNDFSDCQREHSEFREFVTEDQKEQFQRFREAVHEQFARHDLDAELRLLDSWVGLPVPPEQQNFIPHQKGLAKALKSGDSTSLNRYLVVTDAALVFPDAQQVVASYLNVETLTEGCPAISLPDTETAYRNRYLASADAKERACIHLEWGNSHFDDQVGGNCESFIAAVREAQTAGSRIVEAQSLERSGNCRERQDRRDQAIEYFKAAAKADPDRRTRMEGEIRRVSSSLRVPEGPTSGSLDIVKPHLGGTIEGPESAPPAVGPSAARLSIRELQQNIGSDYPYFKVALETWQKGSPNAKDAKDERFKGLIQAVKSWRDTDLERREKWAPVNTNLLNTIQRIKEAAGDRKDKNGMLESDKAEFLYQYLRILADWKLNFFDKAIDRIDSYSNREMTADQRALLEKSREDLEQQKKSSDPN